MPKKESFPQRLRRARLALGLSQYDLADMTGISQRMIVHYEKHSKSISQDILRRLAKTLKVTPNELMGFDPIKEKEPPVKNRRLLKKLKALDHLPFTDQDSIIRHIDDLTAKYKKAD